MALTASTQAQIAFKNLLGKSQTDLIKGLVNESYGIFFNVPKDNVWLDNISSIPTTTILQGTTVKVTANLTAISGSNGHAYFTVWPSLPPSGSDIKTGLPFSYGVGSLSGISAGDRMTNIISDSYGSDYGVVPYDSSSIIPVLDSRTWIYQYNSGIFYQEYTTGTTTPTRIDVYPYIGSKLATTNTQQNIRISALGTNSYYATYSTPIISTYSSNYLFLVDFQNGNTSGTVSLNIDGIGTSSVYQFTSAGLSSLLPGDIIGATGGTAGPIYYLNFNNGNFQFYKTNPVQNSSSFTNHAPSSISVGGISQGTSFNNVLIQDVFNDLIYSNQLDTWSTISVVGPSGSATPGNGFPIVGQKLVPGSYTFSWTLSDPTKFVENTLNVVDNIYDDMANTLLSNNLITGGSVSTPFVFNLGATFSATHSMVHRDFVFSMQRLNGTVITQTVSWNFQDYWYYGAYSGLTANSSIFSNLLTNGGGLSVWFNNNSTNEPNGLVLTPSMNYGGDGYKYIAIPDDINEHITNAFYKNMPIAFASDVDGYTYSEVGNVYNDVNWSIVPVTNNWGVTKNYKVYRTLNVINGTFSFKINY